MRPFIYGFSRFPRPPAYVPSGTFQGSGEREARRPRYKAPARPDNGKRITLRSHRLGR